MANAKGGGVLCYTQNYQTRNIFEARSSSTQSTESKSFSFSSSFSLYWQLLLPKKKLLPSGFLFLFFWKVHRKCCIFSSAETTTLMACIKFQKDFFGQRTPLSDFGIFEIKMNKNKNHTSLKSLTSVRCPADLSVLTVSF